MSLHGSVMLSLMLSLDRKGQHERPFNGKSLTAEEATKKISSSNLGYAQNKRKGKDSEMRSSVIVFVFSVTAKKMPKNLLEISQQCNIKPNRVFFD